MTTRPKPSPSRGSARGTLGGGLSKSRPPQLGSSARGLSWVGPLTGKLPSGGRFVN